MHTTKHFAHLEGRPSSPEREGNRALRDTGAQRFLADASTVLAATLNSRAIFEAIAHLAVPSLGDLCMVHRLDPAGAVVCVAVAHRDPTRIDAARALVERWDQARAAAPSHGFPGAAERVLRGGAGELHDLVETHDEPVRGGALGYASAIVVPIEVRNQVLATLTVLIASEASRRYGPTDQAVAEDFARRGALAIENALLFEGEQHARRAAERAAERMTRLQDVTAALSEALTTGQVAEVLVNHGTQAAKASTSRLYLMNDGGNALVLVARAGSDAVPIHTLCARVPLEAETPAADAARTRAPIWIESSEAYSARYPALVSEWRSEPAALCALPLVNQGGTLGALAMEFGGARAFDDEERSLILTIAAQCAQALDRARLYEAEQRGYDRLLLLADAGSRLAETLDYEATMQKVVELALPALGDFGFLDVVEADKVRRIARASDGDRRVEQLLASSRLGGLGRDANDVSAVTTGKPAIHPRIDRAWLEAAAPSPEQRALAEELALSSMITVPLFVHGRTIGALTLFFARSGRRHTSADLALAGELARRAAAALENARLYADAQDARRQAEEASRMKDEFLGVVSHELRTPLTAILGWARILSNKPNDGAMIRRGLEVIQRNASTQVRIIEDILDVSRTITGKLRLELRPVELEPILHAAVDVLRPTAEAKNQMLALQSTGDTICVLGDPDRLQQVVWNLVSNAIKFTPAGGRIDLRVETTDRTVTVVVTDTGRGMPDDFVPHAFDRFRQADSSATRKHGGLGLGLAIVRYLIELHGGAVHAESDGAGLGSEFRFTLPMLAAPSADPDAERVPSVMPLGGGVGKPVPLHGLRVLVVDDEPDARELLAFILGQHGAEVYTAASAEEALTALPSFGPHVLVSDIAMPVEDGVSLIRKVRALEGELARVPAVALTAYAHGENRQRLMLAGFQMHVSKPIEPAALTAVVANLGGKVLD